MSGIFKFVQLPCLQYQQDGRVVKGLQRGASALTSSTGVAVVELTSQLLEAVQALAQMAYDFVSPIERVPHSPFAHYHKPHHPVDFREGISNAYGVVSTVSYSMLIMTIKLHLLSCSDCVNEIHY